MANRNITFDRQNKTIVAYNASVRALAPFYQTNSEILQIQVVDPTGDPFAPWEVVDYGGLSGLRFYLGSRSTGTAGDSDEFLLAETLEASWVWDAVNKWFTGTVHFNTAEIEAYLGDSAQKNPVLEINIVTGAVHTTIYHSEVLLRANADAGSTSSAGNAVVKLALVDGQSGVSIVDNVVTVTGLTWLTTPNDVRINFIIPDTEQTILFANPVGSSLSASGFTFVMSAIPNSDDYFFTYEGIF